MQASGNSSIAFAETRGDVTSQNEHPSPAEKQSPSEKPDPLKETMVSEQTINFQTDGNSEAEHDTNTSMSIRIESENPRSTSNPNPPNNTNANNAAAAGAGGAQKAGHVSPGGNSISHDIQTESQEDIHFDPATEDPTSSMAHSLRFQVDDSRTASRTVSKTKRSTSPSQPAKAAPAPAHDKESNTSLGRDSDMDDSNVDFEEDAAAAAEAQPPHNVVAVIDTPQPAQHTTAPALESTQPPRKPDEDVPLDDDEDASEAEAQEPPTQVQPRSASNVNPSQEIAVSGACDKSSPQPPAIAVPALPPPRRVAPRAATAARTPRANGMAPTTPRTRSPNSSYRPPASSAGGVPPLAPADEKAQADRAAAVAAANAKGQPQPFARNATGNSEFSSVADGEGAEDAAAAVASVQTPASPNIIITNHKRVFRGAEWEGVVDTSRDTIERTVGNETAAACDIEAQFVRVTSIEADASGMTCEMSIGHAPSLSAEQIDEAINACPYENTLMLLDFTAGHQTDAADATEAAETEEKKPNAPAFSFSEKVGEGMLNITYAVSPFGTQRHLELSFDAPVSETNMKFVKACVSEYLGVHESQLTVSHKDAVLRDDATGADAGLENGSVLQIQCDASHDPKTEESVSLETQQPTSPQQPPPAAEVPAPEEAAATPAKKKKTAAKKAASPKKEAQPAPAQPAPKAKAAKKKSTKAAAEASPRGAAAPAKPQRPSQRKLSASTPSYAAPQRRQQAVPRYATHTVSSSMGGVSFVPNATAPAAGGSLAASVRPALSNTARSRAAKPAKEELPRALTAPRVYRLHSPRPGAENLEEGETMAMYMSASRSPSHDGRSSRHSTGRKTPSRPSAAAPASAAAASTSSVVPPSSSPAVARRSSAASRSYPAAALTTAKVVPPQHTIRGVTSLAFRPRPVIQAPHTHNAVEHTAETHSVSRRSRSPPLSAQRAAAAERGLGDTVGSVNFTIEESAVVMEDAPMQPRVYTGGEAEVYADVPQPDSVLADDASSSAVDDLTFEEDPVPAAAPNPFV